MIRKLTIIVMAMLLGVTSMMARKGYSKPVDVKQPDGTTVTLLMHGDEFLSFMTTTDGFTVVKGDDGFYCYARKTDEGILCATEVVARNPEVRKADEEAFLAGQKKMLHPDMRKDDPFRKSAATLYMDYSARKTAATRNVLWPGRINYSKFKGLVVLVEFNDKKFGVDNPVEFYQKMINGKNYRDTSHKYYPVDVKGSARDYFFDNSRGIFDPTFDVVGPITINYSCTYPHPKKNGVPDNDYSQIRIVNILKAVMNKVNSLVDFNDYDLNNDGVIDMVYIIFAGYGSYVQGNDERYMWPHANDYTDYSRALGMYYDHKYFGRYACSMEIQDYESQASEHVWLDGIGTICHEFSHVLGLDDHYDVNYAEDGEATTSGIWDVMDNGADWNYGLTPVGYNSFESYMLGFTDAKQLEQEGNYELQPFGSSNEAFILNTGTPDEDFFIENRQRKGWDRFLPGHGMLVWRVNTSNPDIWKANAVNLSPSNMNLELLCATPGKQLESNYAPFPGSGGISFLMADAEPALRSSKGEEAVVDLYNIAESADGVITFTAGKDLYDIAVEDFETLALTSADVADVKGRQCSWSLENATVEEPAGKQGNGNRVIKMTKKATLTSSPLAKSVDYLRLKVWSGAQQVKISLKTSTDGQTWTVMPASNGSTTKSLPKNSSETTVVYNQKLPAGTRIQIAAQPLMSTAASVAYVDDITFMTSKSEVQGIGIVTKEVTDPRRFNLMGQRVSDSRKGLVIRGGKKYFVR